MNQDNFSDTSYAIRNKLESLNLKTMVDDTTISKETIYPYNRSESIQNSNNTNQSSNSVQREPSQKNTILQQALVCEAVENNSNSPNQCQTNIVSQTNTLTTNTTEPKKNKLEKQTCQPFKLISLNMAVTPW